MTPKACGVGLSLATVLFLTAGSLPRAAEPGERQVTGRIGRLFVAAENAVILVSEKGTALEVMKLGHGCLISLNGQRVSAENLRVGVIATLHFNDYTKVVTKLEARTPPYEVNGTIERVEPQAWRLTLAGLKQPITVGPETLVLADGRVESLGKLKPGQRATVQCAAAERSGVVAKIDTQQAKIYFRGSRESLAYADGWALFRGDQAVFIADVEVGEKISCRRNLYQAVRLDARTPPKVPEKAEEKEPMDDEKEKDKQKEKEKDKQKEKDKDLAK